MKPLQLNLDIKNNSYEELTLMQGYTYPLEATLTDGGQAFDLTGHTVTLELLKADNTFIIQSETITTSGNVVKVAMIETDFTRASGTGKLQVVARKGGLITGSWVVNVRIKEGAIVKAVGESKDIITIKETIDNTVQKAIEENKKTEQMIVTGGAASKGDIIEINSQLESIVYQLPSSNGVDDTSIVQNAINTYKKIQLNGTYIISNLVINDNVSIIGRDKNKDIFIQKSGATGDFLTVSGLLELSNITLKGNATSATNCITFTNSVTYTQCGGVERTKIFDFNGIAISIGENRNMFNSDVLEIGRCVEGIRINSSDNMFNRTNIGDCKLNVNAIKGGGNIFNVCNFFRATETSIVLENEAYNSTFLGCSIDSNLKHGVIIRQIGVNVSQRGHKFMGCIFFGNSSSQTGTFSNFYISGAKGVNIVGCNFFTYDGAKQTKYIMELVNNCEVNFISNSYDTTTTIPYLISLTNNQTLCTIFDNYTTNIQANLKLYKTLSFVSASNIATIQNVLTGKGYASFQQFFNGSMYWGDGDSNPTLVMSRYNNSSLKLTGNMYLEGGLGIGNHQTATTLGSVARKMEVFSKDGVSLGFVPIYNTIT